MQDDDFEARPNDYLVEPLFAPLEPEGEAEAPPPARPWYRRLVAWLLNN